MPNLATPVNSLGRASFWSKTRAVCKQLMVSVTLLFYRPPRRWAVYKSVYLTESLPCVKCILNKHWRCHLHHRPTLQQDGAWRQYSARPTTQQNTTNNANFSTQRVKNPSRLARTKRTQQLLRQVLVPARLLSLNHSTPNAQRPPQHPKCRLHHQRSNSCNKGR